MSFGSFRLFASADTHENSSSRRRHGQGWHVCMRVVCTCCQKKRIKYSIIRAFAEHSAHLHGRSVPAEIFKVNWIGAQRKRFCTQNTTVQTNPSICQTNVSKCESGKTPSAVHTQSSVTVASQYRQRIRIDFCRQWCGATWKLRLRSEASLQINQFRLSQFNRVTHLAITQLTAAHARTRSHIV